LLIPPVTISAIEHISKEYPARLDTLLQALPPAIIIMATNPAAYDGKTEPSAEAVQQAIASMSRTQKRETIKKVLRTPQFFQALDVLTNAIREGGLPSVAGALGIPAKNGGHVVTGGNVPFLGGYAVEAFLEGVKKSVQDN
jgi:26S proteasome regulatory subunit N13